jgi:hypothetical protein
LIVAEAIDEDEMCLSCWAAVESSLMAGRLAPAGGNGFS